MKARNLIEILKILPEDMEIYVQTVTDDLCSPLELRNLTITKASKDTGYDTINQGMAVITAFIKST